MIKLSHLPLRLAVVWSALVSAGAAGAAGWQVVDIATDGPVDLVTEDAGGAAVVVAGGQPWRVVVADGRAGLRPHEGWGPPPPLPRETLPDGEAVRAREASVATGDIAAAWYEDPTTRYDHAILGDAIEAGALAVTDGTGQTHRLQLPETHVFEDRFPRLADIDGDGRDEVVTIRARLDAGAGVAVYRLAEGGLEEMAEIPVIGRRHRWLNIAGIADLTGDGWRDIALVRTPHIGGTLEIWSWRDGGLVRVAAARGFSNHAIRTREQRLSAIADIDGDGIADLALPSADRTALRLVSAAGGRLRDLASISLPAPVGSDLAVVEMDDGTPGFVHAGTDGQLRLVRRQP